MAQVFNDPKLANVNVYAKVDTKVYSDAIESNRLVIDSFVKDELIGVSTGKGYKNDAGISFVQVKINTRYGWILLNNAKVKTSPAVLSDKQKAQKELAEWISNDIIIYKRLLFLADVYTNMVKKYGFTGDIKKYGTMLMFYINRYKARQTELKKIAYAQQIEAKKTGAHYTLKYMSPGMEYMSDAYYDLYYRFSKNNINGLGAIQIGIGACIIIAAILFGTIATAIYLVINRNSDDSRYDYKITSEMEKWLAMLPPEGRDAIVQGYDEIIQDAYKKGKNDQWWKDIFSFAKPLLWIGLGALIILKGIPWIMNYNKKNYEKASQPNTINK
jgi:hypothetical protein